MKLAAIGSNCVDYYTNLGDGTAFAGGGPVNMAVYTRRLGGDSSYIGPVGKDQYGKLIIEQLNHKGVDTSHIRIKDGKTAVSNVQLINGERLLGDYDEGVMVNNRLSSEDLDFIQRHDVVVCDLWGRLETSLQAIKSRGVRVAFDCADQPDDKVSQTAIENSDYIFFSSDKCDTENLHRKMKQIQSHGPKLVVAMLGVDGSLCFDGSTFYKYGIVAPKEVIDTMGAGDSYIAGFLLALVDQKKIQECMALGAQTAAETISYFGAWNDF